MKIASHDGTVFWFSRPALVSNHTVDDQVAIYDVDASILKRQEADVAVASAKPQLCRGLTSKLSMLRMDV